VIVTVLSKKQGLASLFNCRYNNQLFIRSHIMADVKRTRRNTVERKCLGKAHKRLFVGSNKTVFKVLEKIKKN
jgi:hypothetical protein